MGTDVDTGHAAKFDQRTPRGRPWEAQAFPDECGRLARESGAYFGARLAKMRCSVRLCMLSRRAVSETLRPHSS
jgi:hypothetical protein